MEKRKRRSWFDGKTCQGCGKPATTFRYFNHRHQYVMCDSPSCDLRSRIKAGFFKIELNLKNKIRRIIWEA